MVITKQNGLMRRSILLVLLAGIVSFTFFRLSTSHVAAAGSVVKSGVSGFCLDDYKDGSSVDNKVILWGCNNSSAQDWVESIDRIKHGMSCLGVQDNQKAPSTPVVITSCNSTAPGQVWLKDKDSYLNPNSGMCLTANSPRQVVVVVPCGLAQGAKQSWTAAPVKTSAQAEICPSSKGEAVACFAEREWIAWQSDTVSHFDLLNKYTDGAPYEAWCADFVSYVYKEAGYPFSQAYDGWDENDANNIQNYGFTLHPASSGYIPRPGDIAYFDYNGGHVEIVVSGGKTPTLVYGNSAVIDPMTGNGQMKVNTILDEGQEGQLVYYLSPN